MSILKSLTFYERMITRYPIRTAMITGGTVGFCSDYVSQRITNKYDYKRSLRYICIAMTTCPIVFHWYKFIDRTFKTTSKRLLADQLVFSPFDLMYCFTLNTLMIGGNYIDIKNKIKNDLPETYLGNIVFWGTALSINFRYVPINYRLLYSNVAAFIYNIYLSYKVNS